MTRLKDRYPLLYIKHHTVTVLVGPSGALIVGFVVLAFLVAQGTDLPLPHIRYLIEAMLSHL